VHGAATKLKGELSDANAKIEALQAAAAASSGGKDATSAKLAEVSEEFAAFQQQHEVDQTALKEQLETSATDLAAAQVALTELQGLHAALESEAEGLKIKLETAETATAAAQEALSLVKQDFDEFRVESCRKLRDEVKEAHDSAAASVAFHRDTATRLEDEVRAAIAAKDHAEGRVEVFLKQTDAAKAMAVGLRKELVLAKEEHGRREAAQRSEAAASYALEVQALRGQLDVCTQQLQQLQQQKQQERQQQEIILHKEQHEREERTDEPFLRENAQDDAAVEPGTSPTTPSPTAAPENTTTPADKEVNGAETNEEVPADSEEALALAVAAALGTDTPWSHDSDAPSKADAISSDGRNKALAAAEATAAAAEARALAAESELSAAKSIVGALKRELAAARASVESAEARANNPLAKGSELSRGENSDVAPVAATASAETLALAPSASIGAPKSSPKGGYSSKNGHTSADAQRALSFAALVHSAEKLEADALAESLKTQLAQTTRALEATWRKATAAKRDSEEHKNKLEQVQKSALCTSL